MKHALWVAESQPHILPPDMGFKLLNSGFCYVMKRDKKMRPIVCMHARVLTRFNSTELEMMTEAVDHFLTWVISKCCVRGKAESLILVIDCSNIGLSEIPIGPLRTCLASQTNNFMGRTFKIFILGAGAIIRASFSVLTRMLDEFTTQKISMLGSNYAEVFKRYVDADCL